MALVELDMRQAQYQTDQLIEASPPFEERAAPRQVVVAVDACCELDPAEAAALGVVVLPRPAQVNGRAQTLDAGRTLHHSCWPERPRRIVPGPYELGPLTHTYGRVLQDGYSVLALLPPERIDPAARVALAARSILLAGQTGGAGAARRVAVYELAAAGQSFTFLVQAAARRAAEGMALHQLLTLLDRLQAALRTLYATSGRGPAELMRRPGRPEGVGRMGSEQLWELDRADGLFVCRARGWSLARQLFAPKGPLAGTEPTAVCSTDARLLNKINAGRAQAKLPSLVARPGGLSLAPLFRGGCVELALLPDEAHIARICDVIRRIDRHPAPAEGGVRWRGGL